MTVFMHVQRLRENVTLAAQGDGSTSNGAAPPPQQAASSSHTGPAADHRASGAATAAADTAGAAASTAIGYGDVDGVPSDSKTQPCRHAWAALMPFLSNLDLTCADAVCTDHDQPSMKLAQKQLLPLRLPLHLQVPRRMAIHDAVEKHQRRVLQGKAVRQLYGVHLPSLGSAEQPAQGTALHSMPSRRATRDFHVQKDLQAALRSRRADVPGWGGMPMSSAMAAWQRLVLLPPQAEACAWEALLSRPAAAVADTFRSGSVQEHSDCLLRLTRSLQQLQHQARSKRSEGMTHGPAASDGSAARVPLRSWNSTAFDAAAVQQSWKSLEGITDATGVHAVRSAWIAALGRLQSASTAAAASQTGGGAFGELQAAIQGLQASRQRPRAHMQWGAHAAVQQHAHAEGERASAIHGVPAPYHGTMGDLSTPSWMEATRGNAGSQAAQRPRQAYALSAAHAAARTAGRGGGAEDGREAAIAHAWTRILPCTAPLHRLSGASARADVGPGEDTHHGGVWVALLGEHGPMWSRVHRPLRADQAVAEPPPLSLCSVAPHAHAAWDGLLHFAAGPTATLPSRGDIAGRIPPVLGAARAPTAAQHVWEAMVTPHLLSAAHMRRCWRALCSAPDASPVVVSAYDHATRAVQRGGLQWRTSGVEAVWGALWGQCSVQRPQARQLRSLGGSTFDVHRSKARAAAAVAADAAPELPSSHADRRAGGAGVLEEAAMQRHSNRVAASAAAELHARAARFDREWESWDERWVSTGGASQQSTSVTATRSVPKVYVSALSYIPADLDAARSKCGSFGMWLPCHRFSASCSAWVWG